MGSSTAKVIGDVRKSIQP